MPPITLRLRHGGRSHCVALADGALVSDLATVVEEVFQVRPDCQQLRGGFPPKVIDMSGCGNMLLADLGLEDRDSLTVQVARTLVVNGLESAEFTAPPPLATLALLPSDFSGDIERHVIPGDNSCLFASVIACLSMQSQLSPSQLRGVVRQQILAQPAALEAECQADCGKSSVEYAEWIVKPDSWGGFIDLHILSQWLGIQICSIFIQSPQALSLPDKAVGDARIYVLFDGIHYDSILTNSASKKGVFHTRDEVTMGKAIALAVELHQRRQFTDTAGFTLQCEHCFALVKSEAAARQHGRETGHFNFQEAPPPNNVSGGAGGEKS